MEKQLPFRIDGVYVKKINPEEEFSNYKPTKLKSMWKIAQGKKEYDYYRILYFKEKYVSPNEKKTIEYEADLTTMHGELIMIVDSSRSSTYRSFDFVEIHDDGFSMSNDEIYVSGNFKKPLVRVSIYIKNSGETENFTMRFIPWL